MDAKRAAAGHIVLIVDDEPLQRMAVSDMLYDAGFWTVEASDADQAIRMLESRDDIRIVFLDIVMNHGMNGLELATVIRQRWPRVDIVLTSGKMYPFPTGPEEEINARNYVDLHMEKISRTPVRQ